MLEKVEDIQAFLTAIKENSEYDFSGYSINSLKRRIIKILITHSMEYGEMVEKIRMDPDFKEEVVKKITVNTTDFFRDAELWIYLRENIIPLFSRQKRISVWHPGCSTGQEVYSLMILLNEMRLLKKTDIFASDLNVDVLETARNGVYEFLFSKEYLTNFDKVLNHEESKRKVKHEKYFKTDLNQKKVMMNSFLRKKPVYSRMNLVNDKNPFNRKFDIIFCRNVIIYFNDVLQNGVLDLLYRNMNDKSCLVLGKHESIIGEYESRFIKKDFVYFRNTFR
ncbi:MAG: CheR family methyltransferase [Bacteroidales bacterium]